MREEALRLLDGIEKRPAMYWLATEPESVEVFLRGLRAGSSLGPLKCSEQAFETAASDRGWTPRDGSFVWHMRASGLDDSAIVTELLAVQRDAILKLS